MRSSAILSFTLMMAVFMTNGRALAGEVLSSQQPIPPAIPQSAPQSATLPPLPPGSQLLEIPIPETFRGCWETTVSQIDSHRKLSGWFPFMWWMPKVYQVCFVRRGQTQWELTYSWGGVDTQQLPISQSNNSVRVMRINGSDSVYMEAKVRLVQGSVVKDETTTMKLQAVPSGALEAHAVTIVDWNGRPWMEAVWHSDFQRMSQHLERREVDGSMTVLNP